MNDAKLPLLCFEQNDFDERLDAYNMQKLIFTKKVTQLKKHD